MKKKVKKSKRKSRVKAIEKTPSQVQQDMELFAHGVERLKELNNELASLDTKGFYKEEQSIKSKLKNVSDIPKIEKEIKTLRLKINKKYKPEKRRRISKVGEDIKELKENLAGKERQRLIRNMEDLKEEVVNKKGRALKEDIEELKEDVSKVSELKLEVRKLREEIEKKRKKRPLKKRSVKIDSEIGFLVEKDFDAFVKDIEKKLSERVNEKESNFDEILKKDLEKRQKNFVLKYKTLIDRFNRKKERLEKEIRDKYNLQVQTSLKKEVDEKFNQKLDSRLHKERGKLIGEYKELLTENVKKQVEEQRERLKNKFESEFAEKLKFLQMEFAKKVREEEIEKSRLKEQEQQNIDKQKKLEEKEKRQNILIEKEKEKEKSEREKFNLEKKQELANFNLEKRKEMETLNRVKKNLEKSKQKFIDEKNKEMQNFKRKLADESHKKLADELAKKEKLLEPQMRKDFKLKLDKQIQEHEVLLKKKKLDLEQEMQKKIKQLLN